MTEPFVLYEGILWEPPNGYFLLEHHMARLKRSAAHFNFSLNPSIVQQRLQEYATHLPDQPRKVRLELSPTGAVTLKHENVKPSTPVQVALATEPVDSRDEFLRHKTTRRTAFDRALAAHPQVQDVLLWNERRELTETCHANVVLEINGQRLTPPLSSGLQPGVFRAFLLERNEVREAVLPLEETDRSSRLFLINSVRRWCEMRLVRP